MSLLNLIDIAQKLPQSWSSTVLGQVDRARIKVLRMDGGAYPDECHDYTEALIVLDGVMHLTVQEQSVTVKAGSAYLVPAGVNHGVAAGSHGTLLIIDV